MSAARFFNVRPSAASSVSFFGTARPSLVISVCIITLPFARSDSR